MIGQRPDFGGLLASGQIITQRVILEVPAETDFVEEFAAAAAIHRR